MITKPAFKKWHNTTHKEQSDMPIRSPEANTRTFTNGICIEAIVDDMLQVFHHLNLPYELILVMAHAHKGTNMHKGI
jgi:hypothetical protein